MNQRPFNTPTLTEKCDMRGGCTSGRRSGPPGGHRVVSSTRNKGHHRENASSNASAEGNSLHGGHRSSHGNHQLNSHSLIFHHGSNNDGHHGQQQQQHGGGSPSQHLTIMGEPWYRHKTRPPITNEEKIKSEMCRNLQESGQCPYGTGCRFAHHPSELKQIMRHPKHKTQLCRDYHGPLGQCMFGARCSYIHEPQNVVKQKATPVVAVETPSKPSSTATKTDATRALETRCSTADIIVDDYGHHRHHHDDDDDDDHDKAINDIPDSIDIIIDDNDHDDDDVGDEEKETDDEKDDEGWCSIRRSLRRRLEGQGICDKDIRIMEALPSFLLDRLLCPSKMTTVADNTEDEAYYDGLRLGTNNVGRMMNDEEWDDNVMSDSEAARFDRMTSSEHFVHPDDFILFSRPPLDVLTSEPGRIAEPVGFETPKITYGPNMRRIRVAHTPKSRRPQLECPDITYIPPVSPVNLTRGA